ncbi:MAG: class I SAM-dependent methyltransferase [Deltaproteobacteria bacterium]
MPYLSQSRFPGLWKLFQLTIGGTVDKRKLCLLKYSGQKKVLEVGCSLGNIAPAFIDKNVEYTGIDTDPVAIEYAKKDFRKHGSFNFICNDLRTYVEKTKTTYDYILFAGVLHHIDDTLSKELISAAKKLLAENGIIVIVDPLLPDEKDNWFIHVFMSVFEQGQHLRREEKLQELLESLPGLKCTESESHYQAATPFSFPYSCRFGIHVLKAIPSHAANGKDESQTR